MRACWLALLLLSVPAFARAQAGKAQSIGPRPGPGDWPDSTAANPYSNDRRAIGEGRRFFVWFNCAGCHGDHAGGGMGPSLRDSSWIYGSTDAQIYASIYEGRTKGMPSWRQLPAEQIWKIVAYIKTLRTSGEPERPDQH